MFAGELVAQGEWWRIVTSQLLHQFGVPHPLSVDAGVTQLLLLAVWSLFGAAAAVLPLHIALNAALAMLFGHLVEQLFGARRTLAIFGAAGLVAAAASALAGEDMVGGSGLVLGLAGAVLALEFNVPERLPAPWRLPRNLFILVLVGEALVGFGASFIAGAAHLGGFAGGYLAARVLLGGAIYDRPASVALRATTLAVVVGVVAVLVVALQSFFLWFRF